LPDRLKFTSILFDTGNKFFLFHVNLDDEFLLK
jgi:hypothetical protein